MLGYQSDKKEKKSNAQMEREMRGGKDFYDETRTDISPEARDQIRKLKAKGIVSPTSNSAKRKRRTQYKTYENEKEPKSIEPRKGFIDRMVEKYKGKKKE